MFTSGPELSPTQTVQAWQLTCSLSTCTLIDLVRPHSLQLLTLTALGFALPGLHTEQVWNQGHRVWQLQGPALCA